MVFDPLEPLRRDAERIRNLVGRRVREARRVTTPRITQTDLAERLRQEGMRFTPGQISKIETGFREVTDREIAAIARVLRVPISWLFGDRR
ncbi:hypothetical protein ES703_90029 [subsurface metagenome]